MSKNLNSKVRRTATRWKARAKQDSSNRKNIRRAQAFALELLDYMDDEGIKQKDLAKKMNVSPQQVSKILSAKSNLTFETLDKIEDALGVIISSPTIEPKNNNYSQTVGTTMQVVHRQKSKVIQENLSSAATTKKNAILNPTFENMNEYLSPVKEN